MPVEARADLRLLAAAVAADAVGDAVAADGGGAAAGDDGDLRERSWDGLLASGRKREVDYPAEMESWDDFWNRKKKYSLLNKSPTISLLSGQT